MEFVMADIAIVIECLHLSSFVLQILRKLCAQYVQILHRTPSVKIACDKPPHFSFMCTRILLLDNNLKSAFLCIGQGGFICRCLLACVCLQVLALLSFGLYPRQMVSNLS